MRPDEIMEWSREILIAQWRELLLQKLTGLTKQNPLTYTFLP